jgi:hypothetical protein
MLFAFISLTIISLFSFVLLLLIQLALIFIITHARPSHTIISFCPLHLLAVQLLMIGKTVISCPGSATGTCSQENHQDYVGFFQ